VPRRPGRRTGRATSARRAWGTPHSDAVQRIIEYVRAQRAPTWDRPSNDVLLRRLRSGVRDRLGTHRSAGTTDASLALDDARWLIPRAEGFERWEDPIDDVVES
jgi:hypothetical protein